MARTYPSTPARTIGSSPQRGGAGRQVIPGLGILLRNPAATLAALGGVSQTPVRLDQTPTSRELPIGAAGLFHVASLGRTSLWINFEGDIEEILGGGDEGGTSERGPAILGGTSPPDNSLGRNGDYYVQDRSASDLGRIMYGPKAGGAWPSQGWSIEFVHYTEVPGLEEVLAGKLDRRFLVRSGEPTASDIPAGTHRVVKNTAAGRISIYVNDGGTIIDLLAL